MTGAPAAVCRAALSLFYPPAAPVTLVSCWQERTGGRERAPPFLLLPWPQGQRLVSSLNCAPFHLMEAPGGPVRAQQSAVLRTEHSQDPETVDTGIPAGGFMCAAFILFSIKSWELKWLVVLNLTLFLASFGGYFPKVYLPFPSLFLIYILLWHLCIIVSYQVIFRKEWDIF